MNTKRPAEIEVKKKKESFFYSFKFLPVNLRSDYKTKFKGLSQPPENIPDQAKEMFITLNIARVHPIYFSNNVLESVRGRIHADKFYNSFSCGMIPTLEGVTALDSLIEYISKVPKLTGLLWN